MDLYLERDVGLRKMVSLEKLDIVHLRQEKYEKEEVEGTSKRGEEGIDSTVRRWNPPRPGKWKLMGVSKNSGLWGERAGMILRKFRSTASFF